MCNSLYPFSIIITYQEKSGNYNVKHQNPDCHQIITYQEKSGNYNHCRYDYRIRDIITYQEKSGNYNNLVNTSWYD